MPFPLGHVTEMSYEDGKPGVTVDDANPPVGVQAHLYPVPESVVVTITVWTLAVMELDAVADGALNDAACDDVLDAEYDPASDCKLAPHTS